MCKLLNYIYLFLKLGCFSEILFYVDNVVHVSHVGKVKRNIFLGCKIMHLFN